MKTITLAEACRKRELEIAYYPQPGTAYFKLLSIDICLNKSQCVSAYKVSSHVREGNKIYRTKKHFNNIIDAVLHYNSIEVYSSTKL